MNIKFVKLVSGEDVLADVEVKENEYVLKNPTRLIATREGVGLGPINPLMKEGSALTVGKEHVVYVVEPDEEVRNGFAEQFGGIVLPPTGLNIVGDK
jgi:hypothetical protein